MSSNVIARIRPTYPQILDTSSQRYVEPPTPNQIETYLKLALLHARHIYLPLHVMVDNAGIRKLMTEGTLPKALVRKDLDGYPPIVAGLREGSDDIFSAISIMLGNKVNWDSLSDINQAQEKKTLTLKEFLSKLEPENKREFLFINSFLKDNPDATIPGIRLTPATFKKLILNNCSAEKRPRCRDPAFDSFLDKFSEEVEGIPAEQTNRSDLYRRVERLGRRNKAYTRHIPSLEKLIIDMAYNTNIWYSDAMDSIASSWLYMPYYMKLYPTQERLNPLLVEESSMKNPFIMTLSKISFERILEFRSEIIDDFGPSIKNIQRASNQDQMQKALSNHQSLLVDKLLEKDFVRPRQTKGISKYIQSPKIRLLSFSASAISLTWKLLEALKAISPGDLGFLPSWIATSSGFTLTLMSHMVSYRQISRTKKELLSGLHLLVSAA